MSHDHHQGIAIDCANCGTTVVGEYCHHCGQKARLHRDSFFHMVTHFVADYFHYDHKFLQTLKLLIARPGRLSRAYMEGRRASYLHPIQLYIFVSAVFFLFFFMSFHVHSYYDDGALITEYTWGFDAEKGKDEAAVAHEPDEMGTGTRAARDTAVAVVNRLQFSFDALYLANLQYKLVHMYAYKHHIYSYAEAQDKTLEAFFHNIPKLFFVMMPLFALLLQLFFGRKGFMYVDHAVMSLHFHSFVFISCLVGLAVNYIPHMPVEATYLFGVIIPGIYFLLSTHFFYRRHWVYTIVMGGVMWVGYIYLVLILALLYFWLVTMI
jgi:hypothetical protein